MNMSNKVYNILKYVALIVLPALATLLLGLGELWNIEIMPKIAGTVTLLATFLGALLQVSTAKYWSNKEQTDGE